MIVHQADMPAPLGGSVAVRRYPSCIPVLPSIRQMTFLII